MTVLNVKQNARNIKSSNVILQNKLDKSLKMNWTVVKLSIESKARKINFEDQLVWMNKTNQTAWHAVKHMSYIRKLILLIWSTIAIITIFKIKSHEKLEKLYSFIWNNLNELWIDAFSFEICNFSLIKVFFFFLKCTIQLQ